MMGVAQVYGDNDLANAIAQCGETVGLPWTYGEKKTYVGGILPVGNIIVAYSHVARPWFAKGQHHPNECWQVSLFWRWPTHMLSLLFFAPAAWRFRRRRLSRAASQ